MDFIPLLQHICTFNYATPFASKHFAYIFNALQRCISIPQNNENEHEK